MSEQPEGGQLRWHPLLREWVVVAAHRQHRPQMPADWCPFCPGSGQAPAEYDVFLYPNDFPAFSPNTPEYREPEGLFDTAGARGACDVVLYHHGHTILPSELSVEHWSKVVRLWRKRTMELAADPDVRYVLVFENTGVAIGVTMPHPHGQIYAFPFIPPLAQRVITSSREYYEATGKSLFEEVIEKERTGRVRIVAENSRFVAFVPFAARFPGEVHIYPRRQFEGLWQIGEDEVPQLAALIRTIRRAYDNLYGFPMPLMMVLRQAPVRGEHPYFRFHVEFLPIQRSAKKLKYLAAVETTSGVFLNDTWPEERAEELRKAIPAE